MNIVIIEDEPKSAHELKVILESIRPGVNVVALIASVEEAVQWFRSHSQPDLIFSDIQLSDGVCFDIYSQVAIEAPIIFCTAFDEYMARAFETSGIAYLLKPIVPAKVADTFRKYDNLKAALGKGDGFNARQIEPLLAQYRSPYHSTLLINVREKIMPVKADTIAFLYYNNGVVGITLFNAQQYFVEDTMEALEVKLNPAMFFRVNRQYIVHRHSVLEIERYFSRKLLVKLNLKVPEPIHVSKLKANAFLDWLAQSKDF